MSEARSKIVYLSYKNWGLYNNPEVNERKAELPIAFWFIENFPDRLFEIGEVTPFYAEPHHTVCDTIPEKPSTIKIDANDLDYSDKNVLSISTVEHVGSGDYGLPVEPHKAIKLVKKMISGANNWLITFAVGSNIELEADLGKNGIEFFLLERKLDNTWRTANHCDLTRYKYNDPLPHGNAVIVITNLNVVFMFENAA